MKTEQTHQPLSQPEPRPKLPHEIREFAESDRPFIFDGWIRSYRNSKWAGAVPNDLFWDVYRVVIGRLLDRGVIVRMACLPGEPDALLGFVASESKDGDLPCVHMVYVAPFYRGMGVASSLLAAAVPDLRFHYSFRTAGADRFRRPKYQVAFAPERARRIK